MLGSRAADGVTRLLERHASTVTDVQLEFRGAEVDNESAAPLYKAVAACSGLLRFSVSVNELTGDRDVAIYRMLHGCIGGHEQLLRLSVTMAVPANVRAVLDALPLSVKLDELHLMGCYNIDRPTIANHKDVLASLRSIDIGDSKELAVQLVDLCPNFQRIGGQLEWTGVRPLVRAYFDGGVVARRLHAGLSVYDVDDGLFTWQSVYAGQARHWLADVAGLQLACSDAEVCAALGMQVSAALAAKCTDKDGLIDELTRGNGEDKRELLLLLHREYDDEDISTSCPTCGHSYYYPK